MRTNQYNLSSLVTFLSILGIGLSTLSAFGQNVKVSAKLDTDRIKIGKQAKLSLSATVNKGVSIVFPELKDTITGKIEIVSVGKVDTTHAGNQVNYSKELIITAFDSGYFAIPPFSFHLKGDTANHVETEALLFTVQTVPVDTTLSIKGIKAPLEPAWSIYEIQNELLIGLLILLAIVAVVYYLRTRKKVEVVTEVPQQKRPAHEIALEALHAIREQKLWQQGRVKEYHILVSDTLRTYIEDRYAIGAMEMTSDEIIRSLRMVITDINLKTKLSGILILSDMVKFAKENPLPNENELSWEQATAFVKETASGEKEEEVAKS